MVLPVWGAGPWAWGQGLASFRSWEPRKENNCHQQHEGGCAPGPCQACPCQAGGGGSGKIGTEPHSEGFGFLLFVFFLSLHPHFLVASTSGTGTSLPLGLLRLCQRTLGETLVILELMTGTQI